MRRVAVFVVVVGGGVVAFFHVSFFLFLSTCLSALLFLFLLRLLWLLPSARVWMVVARTTAPQARVRCPLLLVARVLAYSAGLRLLSQSVGHEM